METCAKLAISSSAFERECSNTHNQLNGISERCIHQAANGLTKLGGQLLGRETQQGRERNDGNEVLGGVVSNGFRRGTPPGPKTYQDENPGWTPLQNAGDDTERDEDQQDIHIVARERQPGGVDNAQRVAHVGTVVILTPFLEVVGMSTAVGGCVTVAVRVGEQVGALGGRGMSAVGFVVGMRHGLGTFEGAVSR